MSIEALSPLENLPIEVLGNVVEHLVDAIGSSIQDDSDIKPIARNFHYLAQTSKTMYSHAHSNEVTSKLLHALARKQGHPPEEMAARINTRAARVFLWRYAQDAGFQHIYNDIQEIYAETKNVILEATQRKSSGVKLQHSSPMKTNPFLARTKQGYKLSVNGWPEGLVTPFGKVTLAPFSCSGSENCEVSIALIDRLGAQFEAACPDWENPSYSVIEPPKKKSDQWRKIKQDDWKRISQEEVDELKGTPAFVVSRGGSSVYKITKVRDSQLPKVEMFSKTDQKHSGELLNCLWEMLQRNQAGKDPVEKKTSASKSQREKKTPLLTSLDDLIPWTKKEELNKDEEKLLSDLNAIASTFSSYANNKKEAYKKVVASIRSGWKPATLRDYPNILHTESEEDYQLFVKEDQVHAHFPVLMRRLLRNLGLYNVGGSDDASCHSELKGESGTKHPFLWIKKSKQEAILKALGISVEDQNAGGGICDQLV